MSGWDDPVGRIRELERELSAVRAVLEGATAEADEIDDYWVRVSDVHAAMGHETHTTAPRSAEQVEVAPGDHRPSARPSESIFERMDGK